MDGSEIKKVIENGKMSDSNCQMAYKLLNYIS